MHIQLEIWINHFSISVTTLMSQIFLYHRYFYITDICISQIILYHRYFYITDSFISHNFKQQLRSLFYVILQVSYEHIVIWHNTVAYTSNRIWCNKQLKLWIGLEGRQNWSSFYFTVVDQGLFMRSDFLLPFFKNMSYSNVISTNHWR